MSVDPAHHRLAAVARFPWRPRRRSPAPPIGRPQAHRTVGAPEHLGAELARLPPPRTTEFRRISRERFKVPPAEIAMVEDQLRSHTIVPRPTARSDLPLRDPDDTWVLASALADGAALLTTGDKDLLSIAERALLPILDPRGCWDRVPRTRGAASAGVLTQVVTTGAAWLARMPTPGRLARGRPPNRVGQHARRSWCRPR